MSNDLQRVVDTYTQIRKQFPLLIVGSVVSWLSHDSTSRTFCSRVTHTSLIGILVDRYPNKQTPGLIPWSFIRKSQLGFSIIPDPWEDNFFWFRECHVNKFKHRELVVNLYLRNSRKNLQKPGVKKLL